VEGHLEGRQGEILVRGGLPGARAEAQAAFAFGMGGVVKMAPAGKGPTGSIDQSEIDAETDAFLDIEPERPAPQKAR
jgi:hypothetical protein